jgi:hypothetical protein
MQSNPNTRGNLTRTQGVVNPNARCREPEHEGPVVDTNMRAIVSPNANTGTVVTVNTNANTGSRNYEHEHEARGGVVNTNMRHKGGGEREHEA